MQRPEDMIYNSGNNFLTKILDFEEEMHTIIKTAHELESRRELIKDSVGKLKKSTEKHVMRKS